MSRWLPAPLLSMLLFGLWLLLDMPPTASKVVLAACVAIAVPWLAAPLRPQRASVRRPGLALALCARVIADSLASNATMAWSLLRRRERLPEGVFIRVPLALSDPHGLAALAVITTLVPGTVWCELAHDRSALLLHVLEPGDEQAFVDHFKSCYERPLMEIFR